MKTLTTLSLVTLLSAISACALNSAYTEDQAQADAMKQCNFYDTQKQRTHCMKQIMAEAESKRRSEVEKWDADQKAREEDMAHREAMGLPTD
ncbi:MAG: hypothetical protein ACRBEQ_10565 [Hyphomonas sp.]